MLKESQTKIKRNKYLKILNNALEYIGKNYAPIFIEDKKINERNFVLYLTYVIGMNQVRESEKLNKKDYINGEIYKKIDELKSHTEEAYCAFLKLKKGQEKGQEKDYVNIIPDFVIHRSHKMDNDYRGQKLVVEVKTTNNLNDLAFCWDFLKLNIYIDEFEFKNAVYVIVNKKKEDVDKLLENYKKTIKYISEKTDNLWFFIMNWNAKRKCKIGIYQLDLRKK